MNTLSVNNLDQFLERFFRLQDGIIKKVRFSSNDKNNAEVMLLVRDYQEFKNDGWVTLKLHFEIVQECIVDEEAIGDVYKVMSDGAMVMFSGDCIYIDFAPFTNEPETLDDFRESKCMIGAKKCSWMVYEYSE